MFHGIKSFLNIKALLHFGYEPCMIMKDDSFNVLKNWNVCILTFHSYIHKLNWSLILLFTHLYHFILHFDTRFWQFYKINWLSFHLAMLCNSLYSMGIYRKIFQTQRILWKILLVVYPIYIPPLFLINKILILSGIAIC